MADSKWRTARTRRNLARERLKRLCGIVMFLANVSQGGASRLRYETSPRRQILVNQRREEQVGAVAHIAWAFLPKTDLQVVGVTGRDLNRLRDSGPGQALQIPQLPVTVARPKTINRETGQSTSSWASSMTW